MRCCDLSTDLVERPIFGVLAVFASLRDHLGSRSSGISVESQTFDAVYAIRRLLHNGLRNFTCHFCFLPG